MTELSKLIAEAHAASGAQGDTAVKLGVALHQLGLDTRERLAAYQNDAFGGAEVDRTALPILRQALLGTTAGLLDDVELNTLVSSLARAVVKAGRAPTATPTDGDKAAGDDQESRGTIAAYNDLQKFTGRTTDLHNRCTFVGEARRDIRSHGYITSVPGVASLRRLGVGSSKRKLGLGRLEGSGTAHLEIEDSNPASTDDDRLLQANTRYLCLGLAAALAVEIRGDAFGGGTDGWITPPGRTSQVRLLMTPEAIDEWVWEMTGSPLRGKPYARMVDGVVSRFLNLFAKQTTHPVAILDALRLDQSRYTTDPDPQATPAKSGSAPNGSPTGVEKDIRADCTAWLTSGTCTLGDNCPYNHADSRRGLAQGTGRRGGGARGGGNGYASAPWSSWGYDWQPPAKGKGPGKGGKGGKGANGGKAGKKKKTGSSGDDWSWYW